MKIKEIQERNYRATVKRGQISKKTNNYDFFNKIHEEVKELYDAYIHTGNIDKMELADIILVCMSLAQHNKIDIDKALQAKVIINENRKDGK